MRNTLLVDYGVLESEILFFFKSYFLKRALNVFCDLVFVNQLCIFTLYAEML